MKELGIRNKDVSHQPTTINQQPSTNNHQPTTINQQPTTNNQQPTIITYAQNINH
nr:hypothetical protein [uncultured Flavobacterium sp.]